MENVGNTILVFLVSIVVLRYLVGRSTCFQIYCFRIVEQQAVLPQCNDDDRECLFQTEQRTQRSLSIWVTIPELFVETFVCCFFPPLRSASSLLTSPYTIILTVIDTVKIKHFFIGKKGFAFLSSFWNFFLAQLTNFSAELYAHPSVAVQQFFFYRSSF